MTGSDSCLSGSPSLRLQHEAYLPLFVRWQEAIYQLKYNIWHKGIKPLEVNTITLFLFLIIPSAEENRPPSRGRREVALFSPNNALSEQAAHDFFPKQDNHDSPTPPLLVKKKKKSNKWWLDEPNYYKLRKNSYWRTCPRTGQKWQITKQLS